MTATPVYVSTLASAAGATTPAIPLSHAKAPVLPNFARLVLLILKILKGIPPLGRGSLCSAAFPPVLHGHALRNDWSPVPVPARKCRRGCRGRQPPGPQARAVLSALPLNPKT